MPTIKNARFGIYNFITVIVCPFLLCMNKTRFLIKSFIKTKPISGPGEPEDSPGTKGEKKRVGQSSGGIASREVSVATVLDVK